MGILRIVLTVIMIVASVILSEVAVVSGLQVAQSQSYGPEARGGICRAAICTFPTCCPTRNWCRAWAR